MVGKTRGLFHVWSTSMADHRTMKAPSLWLPEPDTGTLLALAKLAEEASELAARANRCIMQGIRAADPEDGRLNIEHLQEEIADVRGLSALLIAREGLDKKFIDERAYAKLMHKAQWLDDVQAHEV